MKNIIEEISLDMLSSLRNVPDSVIIEKIQSIDDLEQRDRTGMTLLMLAVCYKKKEIINFLLSNKVNINAKNDIGATALHMAVKYGDIEVIRILLENNANVNAEDIYGNTPIMTASHLHAIDVFELLIKYGANPMHKNKFGLSSFDVFAAYPDIIHVFQCSDN